MDLQGGPSEAAANKSYARRINTHGHYVIKRGHGELSKIPLNSTRSSTDIINLGQIILDRPQLPNVVLFHPSPLIRSL